MRDLFFHSALLPTGWASSVRIEVGPDGSIVSVTPDADGAGTDLRPGVGVPGLTNLHSHAFQRAMAGLTEVRGPDGDTFWTWRARMYDFLERLGPDDVEAIATLLYIEMLRHGFTGVVEFHYLRNAPSGERYDPPGHMAQRLVAASRRAGMAMTLLPVLYRASDFGGVEPAPQQRRFVAEVDDILGDIAAVSTDTGNDPDRRAGLALHSLRAVPPADLARAVDGYREMDAGGPVHIHVAEQLREVEACVAWSGARPVEWLLDNAGVDSTWCLVHATHMTPAETASLARSGAVAGLCPTTEANLGDGIFALPDYLAAGGTLGVGTDSHVGVTPAGELRLLEYGQRLLHRARNLAAGSEGVSTGRRLLDLALAGGAWAAGRATGRIEAGARADLVVLDDAQPSLAGRAGDALLDAWIFATDETPVRDVMVGGRWVVQDGRHAEEERASRHYREVMRTVVG